jgi:hypothetical protein
MMRIWLAGIALALMTGVCFAQSVPAPVAHHIFSEDVTEQRRSVYVRLDQRIEEADVTRLAYALRDKAKRAYPRTHVNFFLPGMDIGHGAWASVLFSPEARTMIHGLRRDEEELFLAEHRADKRPLLGSWLTSPPAAAGRLTIYSERGKVYAEWRLRSGLKSVDELHDGTVKGTRRFDVPGAGYYILTKSGDLEIWDKTTLVGVGERIRPEALSAPPVSVAAAARKARAQPTGALEPLPSVPHVDPQTGLKVAAAPDQPMTAAGVPTVPAMPGAQAGEPQAPVLPSKAAAIETVVPPTADQLDPEPVEPKTKPRTKKAKAPPQDRPKAVARAKSAPRGLTNGDEISRKLAGQY